MSQFVSSARLSPRARRRTLVLVSGLALLVACQSDSDDTAVAEKSAEGLLLPADDEILTKLYSAGPRTPAGFYQDPRLGGDASATVRHIHSLAVLDPASDDAAAAIPCDLCTDDPARALDWSQAEQHHRVTPGVLTATGETARYFEFTRTMAGVPGWLDHARVYKCGYLDREGTQRGAVDGPAGRLNARPLDGGQLQSTGEYLWTFSRFNNDAHVVLASAVRATDGGWRHTLTLASRTPGAGTQAGCDRVEVRDWELALDASGGGLTWTLRPVKTMDARLEAGRPRRCG